MIKLLTICEFYQFFKRTEVLNLLTQTSHGMQKPKKQNHTTSHFHQGLPTHLFICLLNFYSSMAEK